MLEGAGAEASAPGLANEHGWKLEDSPGQNIDGMVQKLSYLIIVY